MFADITLIESRASSRVQRAAGQVPAARGAGPVAAARLHAGQVDRRCVGVLHERGGSELPAEQPRPRPRSRADRASTCGTASRRSFAYELPLGGNVLAARHRGPGRRDHPERPAVHRRAPAGHRQQQHRPIEPRVRLQRPAEREPATRRSTARRADAVVQHRAFSLPAVRHVRQRRPQHPDRAGLQATSISR